MIEFVTLNTLTTDVLLTVRGSQITQSEPISKRYLESLAHQSRAVLLKQDLDKGKHPNPDYIQVIQALEVEEVDEAEGSSVSTDFKTFRTKIKVPATLDLNFTSGFMYIGTINGQEIQFSPEGRARYQEYRKYTSGDRIAYLKDGYLYIHNDKEIRYITIRGVFQVPPEVSHLNNPNESIEHVTINSPYPIPISMVQTLKEMMLKQLGITTRTYSDLKNDNASNVEPNVEGGQGSASDRRR